MTSPTDQNHFQSKVTQALVCEQPRRIDVSVAYRLLVRAYLRSQSPKQSVEGHSKEGDQDNE